MLFNPAIFIAVIVYVPASLACTLEIINECLSEENLYLVLLFDISRSCSSSRLGLKCHWILEGTTGGVAVILNEIFIDWFLGIASVNCLSLGIIEGETKLRTKQEYKH